MNIGFKRKGAQLKLIIQLPCYNEEATIGITLAALPKKIEGIDVIEYLIINDGSTDKTVEEARKHGVNHVVQFTKNQGLAKAFMAGLNACLDAGADIIVNTDADNQYCADDIEKLVQPLLQKKADLVIGVRDIKNIPHFSLVKKMLQRLGSWVVRKFSKTNIEDSPSGFRAISRAAAMQLNVFNDYTYTLETIIQAGQKNMCVVSVPIRTNEDLRPSRLVKSIPNYIFRSMSTIVRIFMTYRPFIFFAIPGIITFLAGLAISLRFLYFYFLGFGNGHVQSLLLSVLLMGTGFFLIVCGLIADLISVNRKLLEKIDWRIRKLEEKLDTLHSQITEKK